ncbi:hypothetical protein AAHA92_06238 [Salvia divinorum]|uniref:Uncharacterized protein n=1 Tax=Salvia divinorum TaxID=28513 RepID=A0ABD1I863_SALDI
MAFRAASQLKSMVKNGLGGKSTFTTSNFAPDLKARLGKGDFAPVSIVLGMVVVSTSLGIYTALHQLHSAPNVHLNKSRRETISASFVEKSFFRKVAHLKEPTSCA